MRDENGNAREDKAPGPAGLWWALALIVSLGIWVAMLVIALWVIGKVG